METKQIEVTCPCCSAKLVVDVRTAAVLRSSTPREVNETGKAVLDPSRWERASERVSSRTETSQSGFDDALKKEQSREHDLDDLFEKARQKARKVEKQEPEGP